MTIGKNRSIRKRIWAAGGGDAEGDDKADARNVGENMRDIAQSLGSLPGFRLVTIVDQFNTSNGFVFENAARPLGIVNIYSESVSGTVSAPPVSGMTFDKGVVNVKFSGLTVGTRYTTIRLLVIG